MRNALSILCLLLFATLVAPAAAAPRVQTPGGSQSDKPPPPAAMPPAKSPAAPAKPRDVKPSGGSQGDGIVQDPRAREPNRPRISPPFDKRKGIQALHKQLGGDLWEVSIVTFPMLPEARVSAVKHSDARLVAAIRRAAAAMR